MKVEKNSSEIEISNFPDKEFKVTIIRIITELGKWIEEYNENFIKDLEKYIKKLISDKEYMK